MIEADEKTLWCGNLSEQVSEELLYELFMQAGPLSKVRIARDRDGRQRTFAFITYCHEVSVPYAINLFRGTALFHRTLHLQCRSQTALLPPPIRSTSLDPSFDFLAQGNVKKQFAEMTEQLQDLDKKGLQSPRPYSDSNDELIMASLQGNWSHRHHPYQSDDNNRRHKGNYKNKHDRDNNVHNGKHSHGWRNRNRNNRGPYSGRNKGNEYHRQD